MHQFGFDVDGRMIEVKKAIMNFGKHTIAFVEAQWCIGQKLWLALTQQMVFILRRRLFWFFWGIRWKTV